MSLSIIDYENLQFFFFSVLTKEADSGGNVDTERKGHQPVILGGLYSAVEDEFLPGKTSLL